MKRLIFSLVLLVCGRMAQATQYYVDNCVTVGSDSNNGTSTSTPWLTLGHATATAAASSTVSLQGGCTWREQVTQAQGGTSGTSFIWNAYGTSLPAISGANLVTSWSAAAGTTTQTGPQNVYTPNFLSSGVLNAVNVTLAAGGTLQSISLNFGASGGTATQCQASLYTGTSGNTLTQVANSATGVFSITFSSVNTISVPSAPSLSAGAYWIGYWCNGSLFNGPFDYTAQTGTYAQETYVQTYSSTMPSSLAWPGAGNNSTPLTKVYMTTAAAGPANVWQASLSTQAYQVLENGIWAGFPQASEAALSAQGQWFWGSSLLYMYSTAIPSTYYATVEAGQRLYGITTSGHNYVTVNGLYFYGQNGMGIDGNDSNWLVENSVFYAIGAAGSGTQHGIYFNGSNDTAQNNIINEISDDGIATTGTSTLIQYNTISNTWNGAAYASGDGQGIYTAGGSGHIVRYNLVQNSFVGILDTASQDTNIYGNVVVTGGTNGIAHENGVASHPALIYNNTVLHEGNYGYGIGHAFVAQDSGDHAKFENNVCYSTFAGTSTNNECMAIDSSSYTDITLNNNDYYLAPGATGTIGELNTTQYSTLAAWQTALSGTSFTGKDAASISANPLFVNFGGGNYAPQPGSPIIGVGANLGSTYQTALQSGSVWPNGVLTGTQLTNWNMGAYLTGGGINPFWFSIP